MGVKYSGSERVNNILTVSSDVSIKGRQYHLVGRARFFETTTSRSADRCSPNWANRAAVNNN